MAKKIPVANWVIRQSPKRDPKFHRMEMLAGVGKSTKAPLAIFNKG